VADKDFAKATAHDLDSLNSRISVSQGDLDRNADRLAEGLLMEAFFPLDSMKRYVHRVGELPAYLLEDIAAVRMDDRHLHLNDLIE